MAKGGQGPELVARPKRRMKGENLRNGHTESGTLTSHSSIFLSSFIEFQSNSSVPIVPAPSSESFTRTAPWGSSNASFLLEARAVPRLTDASTSESVEGDPDDSMFYSREVESRRETIATGRVARGIEKLFSNPRSVYVTGEPR